MDNYANMPAGREMDVLVAEKVMGWDTYEEYVHGPMMHGGSMMVLYKGEGARNDGRTWSVDGFCPSADITAAWEVVKKLRLCLWPYNDGWFSGQAELLSYASIEADGAVFDGMMLGAVGETPMLAICRAALKATANTHYPSP